MCVDAIGAASLSEAAQVRARGGAGLGVDEDPIAPPRREVPYVVFDPIVVRGGIVVLEEPDQIWPLTHRIASALPRVLLGGVPRRRQGTQALKAAITGAERDWRILRGGLGSADTADSLPCFALLLDLSLDVEDLAEELLHGHANELLPERGLGDLRRAKKMPAVMG